LAGKGGGRRSYVRDANGRFSSSPGGGGGKVTGGSLKARTSARRSRAKLAKQDAGDSSLSGTASRRAQKAAVTRTAKASRAAQAANRGQLAGGRPAGTMSAKPRPAVARTTVMPRPEQRAPGQGPMAQALRSTLRSLAQLDAQRIREIESITGMPIRRTASPSKPATNKLPGSAGGAAAGGSGRVSDALRANLRQLAQSDARMVREMADLAKPPPRSQLRGTGGGSQRQLGGGRKRRGKKT
jgi:hypothetical protein